VSVHNVRIALLDAAERLYAEHGLDGVAMRDIAQATNQKNTSVVQYYFGTRNGLVLEVFRRRMQQISKIRLEHFSELKDLGLDRDTRCLVKALIMPVAEFIKESGSNTYYARFIEQSLSSLSFSEKEAGDLFDIAESAKEVHMHLLAALDHLPSRIASERIRLAQSLVVSGLASYERKRSLSSVTSTADLEETVSNLVDMIHGALTAPHTDGPPTRMGDVDDGSRVVAGA